MKLRVVLDTNIVLASISRKSPFGIIMDKLYDNSYDMSITNDILLEYEEKLFEKFNPDVAENAIKTFQKLRNVLKKETWFSFNLVSNDVDDNKFSDCAIASNADYLVTNDKHFNVIKTLSFPKLNVINIDEFVEILKTL